VKFVSGVICVGEGFGLELLFGVIHFKSGGGGLIQIRWHKMSRNKPLSVAAGGGDESGEKSASLLINRRSAVISREQHYTKCQTFNWRHK